MQNAEMLGAGAVLQKVQSGKQKPRIAGVVRTPSSPFRLGPAGLGVHGDDCLLATEHWSLAPRQFLEWVKHLQPRPPEILVIARHNR